MVDREHSSIGVRFWFEIRGSSQSHKPSTRNELLAHEHAENNVFCSMEPLPSRVLQLLYHYLEGNSRRRFYPRAIRP
jgi:hypothetical protein